MRYSVQQKATTSGWKHKKWFDDFCKAVQSCEQLKHQNHNKDNGWGRSRVAVKDEKGDWKKIYPL